ncbi:MFS transporter [Bacillus marinisedimentorum]|uniref:MFS transporter n=1 Tax=Bacillus marinisedimentorum TaxID=1821260 RepID=UPI0024818353|nr:major facilitator superfamily domain-containing protein 6 [Bacillus marinisedimentorum]
MEHAAIDSRYHQYMTFKWFYFTIFFGFGGLFPLLAVYLRENGLTGGQIGIIMSISPVVMILIQPMWGMIADYTQKPRYVLAFTILATALAAVFYSFAEEYWLFIAAAALLAFFQSSIVPISDSITLNYVQKEGYDYGAIRLWGAVGFAVSVLVVGRLSESAGLWVIFYIFALVLAVSAIFSWKMPEEGRLEQVNLGAGLSTLLKLPRFVLFLITTFLVFGPIFANNFYFGIFVQDSGGTLTGVGLAFLLAAGSEAPFMKFASAFIRRLGMIRVLFLAALVSGLRWLFYFYEPSLALIYATTVAQGFSIGLFIPAALQYVRDISPKDVRATAVSLYSAMGNGAGSWFSTFIGGIILERAGIFSLYMFFSVQTAAGVLLLFVILQIDRKKRRQM